MPEKRCPKCHGLMSRLVTVCPHCGEKLKTGSGTGIGLAIGVLVLGGAVAFMVLTSVNKPQRTAPPKTVVVNRPAPTKPTAPPPKPPAPKPTPPPPEPAPPPKPQLTKGMTTDAVRAAFGKPEKTRVAASGDTSFEWWDYASGQELKFINGKLESWTEGMQTASAPGSSTAQPTASTPRGGAPQHKLIYAELRAAIERARIEGRPQRGQPDQSARLIQLYTRQIRTRYGLSQQEQEGILAEGDAKHWPTPGMLFRDMAGGKPPVLGETYVVGTMLQLMLGSRPPTMGAPQFTILQPGTRVRVAKAEARGRVIYYQLQPAGTTGAAESGGWVPGLTVITPSARTIGRGASSASP